MNAGETRDELREMQRAINILATTLAGFLERQANHGRPAPGKTEDFPPLPGALEAWQARERLDADHIEADRLEAEAAERGVLPDLPKRVHNYIRQANGEWSHWTRGPGDFSEMAHLGTERPDDLMREFPGKVVWHDTPRMGKRVAAPKATEQRTEPKPDSAKGIALTVAREHVGLGLPERTLVALIAPQLSRGTSERDQRDERAARAIERLVGNKWLFKSKDGNTVYLHPVMGATDDEFSETEE